jgi:hypothetical protein
LEWLLGFYTLPPNIQIASTKAYQEGKVTEFLFFLLKPFFMLSIFWIFFVIDYGWLCCIRYMELMHLLELLLWL